MIIFLRWAANPLRPEENAMGILSSRFQKYRPYRFTAFLLLMMLFQVAVTAHAEEVILEEALNLFYKNNYDILISRYEIDKSYGDVIGARLIPNPNFSFSGIGIQAKAA